MILNIFSDRFLRTAHPVLRPSPRPGVPMVNILRRVDCSRVNGAAHSIPKDKQHAQFHRSALHLATGWSAAWDRPRPFARSFCRRRERKQFFRHFPSSGHRLFESSQQRGAAARSRVVVSAHGRVFEREPAGRGRGIFLGATKGIRLSTDCSSKSALSERHRIVARAARILCLVAAPSSATSKKRSPHWNKPSS